MPRCAGMVEWQTPDGFWVPVVTAVDLVPRRDRRLDLVPARVPGSRSGSSGAAASPFTRRARRARPRAMHLALADSPDRPGRRPRRLPCRPGPADARRGAVRHRLRRQPHAAARGARPSTGRRRTTWPGMLVSLENVGHVAQHYAPRAGRRRRDRVDRAGAGASSWRRTGTQPDALLDPALLDGVRARPDPSGTRVRRLPPAAVALRPRGRAAPKEDCR